VSAPGGKAEACVRRLRGLEAPPPPWQLRAVTNAMEGDAMIRLALAAAAASLALAAGPVGAQEQAPDDILSKIINVPAPSAYRVDGTRGEVRKDEAVQGGKALRVAVPGKSDKPWSVAVANPISKPVKAGDRLVLAFWARLAKGEGGATSASLPYNAVQLAADPWTPVFTGPVTIGPEWKLHEVQGKADKDYAAGALNVSIHLATAKQTIDLGPVFVVNMGQ
jgi:hypothetical protein